MADKLPAMPWYAGDWFKDRAVAMCSPATRGIWVDLLLSMWTEDRCGQVTGTIAQLAKLARCSEAEMTAAIGDLEDTKTANVTNSHGKVTITNRRMRRDFESRKDAAKRKKRSRDKIDPDADDNLGHANVTTPLSVAVSISSSNTPPHPPPGEQRKLIDDSMESERPKAEPEAAASAWRDLIHRWNGTAGVVKCREGNDARRKALKARLKERVLLDAKPVPWLEAALACLDRKFPLPLCESDPDGWKPDIDWLLRPASVLKILEGKFDWQKNGKAAGRPERQTVSIAQIMKGVE
jgi:hypothetical protein